MQRTLSIADTSKIYFFVVYLFCYHGFLASEGSLSYLPLIMGKLIDEQTTYFGYRKVGETEKASLVKEVFDNVSNKYDLMNDVMSMGVHRLWKNVMIDWLAPKPGMTLLDVGGGTGDIPFRVLARLPKAHPGSITVVDINSAMLRRGREHAINRGIINSIKWINGDAENLPVNDMSVDAYTIAFCIRNVTHIARALSEARRVLKPGGRFLCLEFSHVTAPILSKIYDAYSFKVLPMLGAQIAGDRTAYQYLAESIRQFPDQSRFTTMILDSGLGNVKVRNLSGGIAALHSAWRI